MLTNRRLPRLRGDGPITPITIGRYLLVAPPARGWTHPEGRGTADQEGCPACAGMDPVLEPARIYHKRLPRLRGDGPLINDDISWVIEVAPPARGWTLAWGRPVLRDSGCPACAGMDPPQ